MVLNPVLLTKVNRAVICAQYSYHLIGVDACSPPPDRLLPSLIYLRDKQVDEGRKMASDRASLTGLAE